MKPRIALLALGCSLSIPARLWAQPAEEPPPASPETAPETEPAAPEAAEAEPVDVTVVAPVDEVPVDEVPVDEEPAETDVLVIGSRLSRVAGSAQVINQKKLERFEYDDPHAVLQQVPGVYVRQEDGVGLRPNIALRGANPDRSKKVTLMEDGILFGPAPYSAPAAYYFPLVSRMTSIRVIKGPSAIAYGPQTVGGAIDFITRAIPSQPAGGVDFALGEYGYDKLHAHFGSSTEQLGFLAEVIRLHNNGFKELPDPDADTGATRYEWMGKVSYLLDPSATNGNRFELKLTYSDEVSNETYLGLTDADLRDDPYRRYPASALDQMKNHRFGVVVSHHFDAPESRLKLSTRAYRHTYSRVWRKVNRLRGSALFPVLTNPGDPGNDEYLAVIRGQADSASGSDTIFVGPNDRTFVSQGLESVLDVTVPTGPVAHAIQAGARLHYDSIERRHSEDEFAMAGGVLTPAGTTTIVTTADYDQSYALALHASDAISWRALTVTPGARVELIRSESENRLNGQSSDGFVVAVMPGAGVFYELTQGIGLLAGVYRGFSPPPPGSNDDVDPEYSVNYELGSRLGVGPSRAELIGFYNDYSNLTDICTLSSGCVDQGLDTQFDAGEARVYGLEAYLSHEITAGPLKAPLSLAYTLTHAKFLSSFDSADPIYGAVEDGDEVPYVPRHQASVTFGLESEHLGGSVAGYYVSPMRERAGSEPLSTVLATDEQVWADVSAYVKPLAALSIYGNVRNVFGTVDIVSRRPYGARPNPPRWVQVGAKLAF